MRDVVALIGLLSYTQPVGNCSCRQSPHGYSSCASADPRGVSFSACHLLLQKYFRL